MGWSLGLGSLPVACLLLVGSLLQVETQERSREVPCLGLGCLGDPCEAHYRKAHCNCWVGSLQASFAPGDHTLLAQEVLPFSFLDAVGDQEAHQVEDRQAFHPC